MCFSPVRAAAPSRNARLVRLCDLSLAPAAYLLRRAFVTVSCMLASPSPHAFARSSVLWTGRRRRSWRRSPRTTSLEPLCRCCSRSHRLPTTRAAHQLRGLPQDQTHRCRRGKLTRSRGRIHTGIHAYAQANVSLEKRGRDRERDSSRETTDADSSLSCRVLLSAWWATSARWWTRSTCGVTPSLPRSIFAHSLISVPHPLLHRLALQSRSPAATHTP